MHWWIARGLVLIILFGGSPVAVADSAKELFRQGIAAFQVGDYHQARERFLEARRTGLDTTALRYNLGSTYYQLEEYDAAQREFTELLGDDDTAPIAHYNLGLVARRQGRDDDARQHFRTASDTAAQPQLRLLAETALRDLEPRARPKRWLALVSLVAGYDDNVMLAPEADLVGVDEKGDSFIELLAAGRYQLRGDRTGSLRLDAGLYVREYADVHTFDQSVLRLGMTQARLRGDWKTGLGAHVDTIFLGGKLLEHIVNLSAEGGRAMGVLGSDSELWLRYRLSRIEADDDFEQLTGWRHRARVEGRWDSDVRRSKLGYEFEWNDRENLQTASEFFSQSPIRNKVFAEWRLPVGTDWELSAGGEYRHSRYREATVTVEQAGTREDNRAEASLGADRFLGRYSRLYARYSYMDNDSNFDQFDYTRNEIFMGGEWLF